MAESVDIVASGKQVEVRLSGKLTKEAYAKLVPVVDQQIKEFGKLRILLILDDFHGWTMGALLVDTLTNAAELTRPAVMEQALNIDNLVTGLALPASAFNTSIADGDKFPEEVLQLMQYSDQLGYYEFLGDPQDFEGRTAELTPDSLLTP